MARALNPALASLVAAYRQTERNLADARAVLRPLLEAERKADAEGIPPLSVSHKIMAAVPVPEAIRKPAPDRYGVSFTMVYSDGTSTEYPMDPPGDRVMSDDEIEALAETDPELHRAAEAAKVAYETAKAEAWFASWDPKVKEARRAAARAYGPVRAAQRAHIRAWAAFLAYEPQDAADALDHVSALLSAQGGRLTAKGVRGVADVDLQELLDVALAALKRQAAQTDSVREAAYA
jgi:hypothetical protein